MTKRKKILHTMTWLAPGGGVDNNVFLTINDLKDKFDFHLVTGKEIHHNLFEGIPNLKIFICPFLKRSISPLNDLKALWYFIKLMKREKYDIVHTHETKASLIGRIAAFFAGTKFIIYGLHGVAFNDPMSKLKRILYINIEKYTLWMVDRIISVSKDCIDIYHKNKIGRKTPYTVIYSGIDTSKFVNTNTDEKENLKKRLGFNKNDIVLINIGRFSKAKGQKYTLEAISPIINENKNVKCIFIGKGGELEPCRKIAKNLKIDENIIFYGFSDNISLLLKISDIMVITSLREGLPRVVVEASLAKVPTVGFSVEGINEIIENEISGFIVLSGDIKLLSEKINVLINSPQLRNKFALKAFNHALNNWDYKIMTNKIERIYNNE